MQELATEGGRSPDSNVLANSEWSGIASGFAAMKRLSGGRDKENRLRYSKRASLGDYQTLLWSLFDAGNVLIEYGSVLISNCNVKRTFKGVFVIRW